MKLTQQMLMDETEMRAFYESVGISKSTIEAAIQARRKRPVDHGTKAPASQGRKKKKKAIG
jgi:hypothetical protein